MLLVQTSPDRLTEILDSHRPIAFVPAGSRKPAKEIAVSARDGGLGVCVIEERSRGLLVVVVGDEDHVSELRRFVRRFNSDVAGDRHLEIERAYVPASWLTGLAHSQGAGIGLSGQDKTIF